MQNRRFVIMGSAALGLAAAMPSRAQTAKRPNPMPEELRKALEHDPNAPVIGNTDGDITLTEFFDYNCGYCRQAADTVRQLVEADPGLRVVFRELPFFGEGSEFAARASLASQRQDRYWQFHQALMAMKERAVEGSVTRVARQAGLDMTRLRADMERPEITQHIDGSFELADHMGLTGTPAFIAGDEVIYGVENLAAAQALIARARQTLG